MIWTNTGPCLYVVCWYVWLGVSGGDRGDASFVLYNATQSIIWDDGNDDHYGDSPGMPARKDWSPYFGKDAFVVAPNDQVIMGFTANADDQTPLVVQGYVRCFYRMTPNP
jgi:hypothetical protein